MLKFHWSLPIDGEKIQASQATRSGIPDLPAMAEFCQVAEACGIDSLLTPFGFHMPDPIPLVSALAAKTTRIKFLIAYRAGLLSPTLFVQQINTLSHIVGGRLSLNMIAGTSPTEQASYGDFANHDARYARANEFIQICRTLWTSACEVDFEGDHYHVEKASLKTPFYKDVRPEIYVSGNSDVCKQMALRQADCWLRYADSPEAIKQSLGEQAGQMRGGLRLSVIVRPTHEEAIQAAYKIVANPDLKWKEFVKQLIDKSDSVAVKSTYNLATRGEWLTPTLWTGAVPYRGGPAVAVVGDPKSVASTFMEFRAAGCSEFILSGWPNLSEMQFFAQCVLPEIRNMEATLS